MQAVNHIRQADVQLSHNRPIRVQRLRVEMDVLPHDHDYHEISLILAGRCRHRTPTQTTFLRPGDVIVIDPQKIHAFDQIDGLEVVNIYYLSEWLASDAQSLWCEPKLVRLFASGALIPATPHESTLLSLTQTMQRRVEHELRDLSDELESANPTSLWIRMAGLKLLSLLSRVWQPAEDIPFFNQTNPTIWRLINEMEQAIHGGTVFSLASASQRVGLRPEQASDQFRAAMGETPIAYYQKRRVHRATRLLGDMNLSITEIAFQLGYTDGAHFCRQFQKHHGLRPREYRRVYGSNG